MIVDTGELVPNVDVVDWYLVIWSTIVQLILQTLLDILLDFYIVSAN
jgi:hypothetical protein